jgi:thiol-disulfide isomerase/thioredoxin
MWRRIPHAVLPALLALACGGSSKPDNAKTTVMSLRGLDCAGCLEALAKNLEKQEGVYDTSIDRRRAELAVVAEPSFDAFATAKKLAKDEEFELVLGAGKGTYLPWKETPQGADVKVVVENGEDLPDLQTVLVEGKVTIVDFSAIWCEPCRKLDEHLMKVAAEHTDVAYRKLDVGDWDTPLAARYLKNVRELPYVIIYDKRKKKVAQVEGLNLPKIDAAIAQAQ